MKNIPIIDFSVFGDGTLRSDVVRQVYQACHGTGFMYLRNHGISEDLIESVFGFSRDFFSQPLSVKEQIAWSDEFSNVGYVGMERERLDPSLPGDLKEALNIGAGSDLYQFTNPSSPLPTPHSPLPLLFPACTQLANTILQAIALALDLPLDFFTNNHNEEHHTLRLLHYPPLESLPKPGQVRAGEHSDYGSITLLFQDDIGGLEVLAASGEWIAAPAIPGTVLVNTGDLMQRWTNDVFCSTKHRVMVPLDGRVRRSRYSIAFFCHPNDDTEIVCLDSCRNGRSPVYPPVLAGEYLLSRLQATY